MSTIQKDSCHKENSQKDCSQTAATRRPLPAVTFVPAVDILEGAHEWTVVADVPGAGPSDIAVDYERGELSITAKVAPRESHAVRAYSREYRVGDFRRVFRIGEDIDSSRIEARVADGVLTLHLPKTENVKSHRIEVKPAD